MSTSGTKINASTESTLQELRLEAFLAEYKTLRDEILGIQQAIRQLSTLSFASIAGLATLVVTLMNSGNAKLLALVLLFLPLPFTAMLFSFVGYLNAVTNLTQYIKNYIEPQVNSLLRSSSDPSSVSNVLYWENYPQRQGKVDRWLTEGLWAGGQSALMFIPLIGSLIAFCFVVTEDQLSIPTWWVVFLLLDLILLVASFSAAAVPLSKRGLLGKGR